MLVAHLGVRRADLAQVYSTFVLPALAKGSYPPALRDQGILQMLQVLPTLLQQDYVFEDNARRVAFLPNRQGQLCTPPSLYDPRQHDLAALLDPAACFPAEAFASNELALNMLLQLGLRASPGLDTMVQAAEYVEELAGTDPAAAAARGQVGVHAMLSLCHAMPCTLHLLWLRGCEARCHGICLHAMPHT